jgi:hypothetical protein
MFDPTYKCLPKAEHYDHHEYVLIWKMPPLQKMQLHTGAERFGNVIFRYSELTSQYHIDASIDVYHT